jgi:hypothetical protein
LDFAAATGAEVEEAVAGTASAAKEGIAKVKANKTATTAAEKVFILG